MKTKFPKKWFRSLNGDADYYRYNSGGCYLYRMETDDIPNQTEFFDILSNLKFTIDCVYMARLKYVSMMHRLDDSNYFTKIKSNNVYIKNHDSETALLFKFNDNKGNIVYIITDYTYKFKFKFDYELFSKHFSSDVSFFKVDETTFKNTLALDHIIDDCKSIVDDRKQAEIKQYRIDNNLCIKCGSEFTLIGSARSVETFGVFNYYRCKNDNCKHEFKRKQDENLS